MAKPIVAIVGRPNVGKSTLFNRIVGRPVAIVEDEPGTTRDRIGADTEWSGYAFTLVDTGGLEITPGSDLARRVKEQAEIAIREADVVIFLVDVREGITASDLEVADLLRRSGKPVIVAVNKCDNPERRLMANEFYQLGLAPVVAISALHGQGINDLLDEVVARLPARVPEEEIEAIRAAIVGRPNVGKSSLLNAIVGSERAIVSEQPGTTRDTIDTLIEWRGERIILVDTAGIRRRGRIEAGIERYSVLRALRAINRSDISVLVLDAVEGVTAQDAHLAGYIRDAGRGCLLAVNKWDLIPKTPNIDHEYTQHVRSALKFMPWAPIIFLSAKTGENVQQVLDLLLTIQQERSRRVPTAVLNEVLRAAIQAHPPPPVGGKRLKIYYITQAEIRPPTFVFFVNDPDLLHFSYERFLENRLREAFGFQGTALRLIFRARTSQQVGTR